MSGEEVKTEVVVVGMPSCGKTVFFTVLGKKFTSLVDGRSAAPLGFRMSTCDKATANVVSEAYDRLRNGKWPESTKEGQIMPLRWEVFTGRRRVFELYSMDIAGETFKKAFGIDDGKDASEEKGAASPRAKSKRKGAGDDELFHGQSSSDEEDGSTEGATGVELAADRLKQAVKTAKVVCFMVNIALPDRRGGKAFDEADEAKLLRFRSSVMNMYLSLREHPDLRAKSIIVLTQSHQHGGEIERVGGPVMYLGDMCGGEGAELSNLAKEHNVPVIAVSAINEERDSNELPEINSPGDIPSSGLFGFLLTVAGMVAGEDGLARVKDAYLAYQRERVEYLKSPTLDVKLRLQQARRYSDASDAYVEACNGYLDNIGNLGDASAANPLPPGTQRMYKQCTNADAEVRVAVDKEYLVRDELWDGALRRVAVARRQDSSASSAAGVYAEVREGLLRHYPEKRGNAANEEFFYGFGEDDLLSGSAASTFNEWIDLNIRDYAASLESDILALEAKRDSVATSVKALASRCGADDFGRFRKVAELSCGEFFRKMEEFRKNWFGNGEVTLSDVNSLNDEVASLKEEKDNAVKEHGRLVEEGIRRQHAREVARRRRKVVTTFSILLVLGAALLFAVRYFHDKGNLDAVSRIAGAVSRSDYKGALKMCDSLTSVKWLQIDEYDHLCPDFRRRLALAAEIKGVQDAAAGANKEFLDEYAWLAKNTDVPVPEVSEAFALCSRVNTEYQDFPWSTSFDDIKRQDVDLRSKMAAAQSRTNGLVVAIAEVKRARQIVEDYKKHLKFDRKAGEFQKWLKDAEGFEKFDKDSLKGYKVYADKKLNELQKDAGENEKDKARLEELKKQVVKVMAVLEAKLEKALTVRFKGMFDDVRVAIASNSVDEAWRKYDNVKAAVENEKFDGGRKELENLQKSLLDMMIGKCTNDLQRAEAKVKAMNMETGFSKEMVDATRKVIETLDAIKDEMRKRLPEGKDDFKRLESRYKGICKKIKGILERIKDILGKLPTIVQFDYEDESGQPVDVFIYEPQPMIISGTSPESRRKCVYMRVMQSDKTAGAIPLYTFKVNERLVGASINWSDLVPGINRYVNGEKSRKEIPAK